MKVGAIKSSLCHGSIMCTRVEANIDFIKFYFLRVFCSFFSISHIHHGVYSAESVLRIVQIICYCFLFNFDFYEWKVGTATDFLKTPEKHILNILNDFCELKCWFYLKDNGLKLINNIVLELSVVSKFKD